jgi:glycine dehydrogenase
MFDNIKDILCDVTGYDGMSLQPNSGAQGELAGLMAIRGYHKANGDDHRNICLCPVSAHGTNPASASMAGFTNVDVKVTANGAIDMDDIREKNRKAWRQSGCADDHISVHFWSLR